MKVLYRIAPAKHAHDLSGEGARLTGGRWNAKATAVLYTSETRSLAAMEYLVHVSLMDLPPEIKIVSIGIPNTSIPKQIDVSNLPEDWHNSPTPFALAKIGTDWVSSMGSLLLRVPSAVIIHEFNILINLRHPEIKSVSIIDVEDFKYDERLYKTTKT